jgi:Protein of unknown function (DUF3606)
MNDKEPSMIDSKQQSLEQTGIDDAEVSYLQRKTGITRAAIIAAIQRVGHNRRDILDELKDKYPGRVEG